MKAKKLEIEQEQRRLRLCRLLKKYAITQKRAAELMCMTHGAVRSAVSARCEQSIGEAALRLLEFELGERRPGN